jgi:ABC-type glycerol-3-phosphate transport system permease component
MKNKTTGTLSGCILWILLLGIISTCILPIFFVIGSITSFSQYAITTTGNFLCPAGTTPESYSYETTTTDEFGNVTPATGVELHCVDKEGTIVKNDPVVYAFIWIGIFVGIGLIISGIVAFIFAAPAGVLITRFLNRRQKPDISVNIEPQ